MKRRCDLTFLDDEQWATFKEALRQRRKRMGGAGVTTTDAELVAQMCREYLDAPVTVDA